MVNICNRIVQIFRSWTGEVDRHGRGPDNGSDISSARGRAARRQTLKVAANFLKHTHGHHFFGQGLRMSAKCAACVAEVSGVSMLTWIGRASREALPYAPPPRQRIRAGSLSSFLRSPSPISPDSAPRHSRTSDSQQPPNRRQKAPAGWPYDQSQAPHRNRLLRTAACC